MTRIHRIKLKISNCYLVEGAQKILVDTGSPGESKKIIKELKAIGVELSDISLILHTHGHSDHCGSTQELIRLHKIPTAIHSADSHMTVNGKNDAFNTISLFAKFIKPFVDIPYPPFKADILIDNYPDLRSFGINGSIHLTKGHTNGSISIVLDNHEAIIGDVMMGGFIGGALFPHLPDFHYFYQDLNEIRRSIHKILSFKADTFYVGHGGPLNRERIEKRFN